MQAATRASPPKRGRPGYTAEATLIRLRMDVFYEWLKKDLLFTLIFCSLKFWKIPELKPSQLFVRKGLAIVPQWFINTQTAIVQPIFNFITSWSQIPIPISTFPNNMIYYMAQVTSGKMAHCDWLLTWRDFSVMTAGIMTIVNALWTKTNSKS